MPAKKTTRKGTKRKRHKSAIEKKAAQMLRWYHEKDVPLRQLIRGAVGDHRVLGTPEGDSIDIGDRARKLVQDKVVEALNGAKTPAEICSVVRQINKVEQTRHQVKKDELDYSAAIAQTYLGQIALQVQASIDNMDEEDGSVEAATRAANSEPADTP